MRKETLPKAICACRDSGVAPGKGHVNCKVFTRT